MSRTSRAAPIRIVTPAWLPGRKPNATPLLRVLTSSMPGRKLCSSPGLTPLRIRCLLSWSRATTSSATPPAARQERIATLPLPSAVDQALDDDEVDDLEREDRDDRAEVPAAEAGQRSPEQPEERFDGVAQELEHGVAGPRVRRPQPGREQQLDHDVDDDDDYVDVDDRRQDAGDLGPRGRQQHQRFSSTASSASLNAA